MKFVSTRDKSHTTTFHDAVFQGLAPDGGLYIPTEFPTVEPSNANSLTLLGQAILTRFITEISVNELQKIIEKALNFPIPLVLLEDNLYLLEVFHGPTLAFKDVGARFMANVLAYFLLLENKKIAILVATSGDTGSAIANAFHQMPNIDVYILYPSNKITPLQEQQMTTLGDNVHALEVEGTFDDCQQLVKAALLDNDLRKLKLVTTANSINLARLLPQIIYHSFGIYQLQKLGITETPTLSVPSGNFGNLTSAIYAKAIGFPIEHFIAATNINAIVPRYLETSRFEPKPSQKSLSNAMDVGNPSNFERLVAFYQNDINKIRQEITGTSITDDQTLAEIKNTYKRTGYILDPHTAIGVAAARQSHASPIIITATAHPTKFPEVIVRAIGKEPEIPERLKVVLTRKKKSTKILPEYEALKGILQSF
jgi:threonine synthase